MTRARKPRAFTIRATADQADALERLRVALGENTTAKAIMQASTRYLAERGRAEAAERALERLIDADDKREELTAERREAMDAARAALQARPAGDSPTLTNPDGDSP